MTKIVIGLGNYGDKYAYTYHNLGFLAAECLADKLGAKFKSRECDSLVARAHVGGNEIIIAKPLTYMNLSGKAVKGLMKKYKTDFIVVFCDDVDLPEGTIRVRQRGSGGTHNGMRNIVEELKSEEFCRIRIGMGRPPEYVQLYDYVLSEIPKEKRQMFASAIDKACDEAAKLILA